MQYSKVYGQSNVILLGLKEKVWPGKNNTQKYYRADLCHLGYVIYCVEVQYH